MKEDKYRHDKLYHRWIGMKQRCYNPNSNCYKHYGQRGIRICDEWKNSYQSFKEWAFKTGYKEELTLDRIDNNGDYSPENCRWVDRKIQCRNRRKTLFVEVNGDKIPLKEFTDKNKLNYDTIRNRLKYKNWDMNMVVKEPLKTYPNMSSNTNEKYITFNKTYYMVRIGGKYIGSSKKLDKAIEIRDNELKARRLCVKLFKGE